MINDHGLYMQMALEEAGKGLGRTSPNPAVGAVIVKGGEVIGRGYHHRAGTPHAEIHALDDAGPKARGATLYVTLEPCNHTGRTPPCTEAILRAGIATVVIGMADPNPRVTGGGGQYLQQHGVEVVSGVLEERCRALNRPFIKHSATGLPWIIMKAGLSLDGKLTLCRGQATALTGPESQRAVHQLRNRVDAILIGVETALIDNPSLTTRLDGVAESRDPLRIVLDSRLRLPADARMLTQDSTAATWIVCSQKASSADEARLVDQGARVLRLPQDREGRIDLNGLVRFLGDNNLTSVLVEGGARVHGAFYRQGLVDELLLFYAPCIIGDQGVPLVQGFSLIGHGRAPVLGSTSVQSLGDDFLFRALLSK